MSDWAEYQEFLNHLFATKLSNADGHIRKFQMNSGLDETVISNWEIVNQVGLPEDYRRFVSQWNGGSLFGLEIVPLEQSLYEYERILAIHNWGNGDFDGFEILSENKVGQIVFANHENGLTFPVRVSFYDWLRDVIEEMLKQNVVYHPMDYSISKPNYQGIYSHIPYA